METDHNFVVNPIDADDIIKKKDFDPKYISTTDGY